MAKPVLVPRNIMSRIEAKLQCVGCGLQASHQCTLKLCRSCCTASPCRAPSHNPIRHRDYGVGGYASGGGGGGGGGGYREGGGGVGKGRVQFIEQRMPSRRGWPSDAGQKANVATNRKDMEALFSIIEDPAVRFFFPSPLENNGM